MFYNLLLGLHFVLTVVLILVILVQTGKGAEIGAVFGGGGAVFGGVGAAKFMHKLTIGLSATFMVSSLVLAVIAPESKSTIFKPVAATASHPATPAAAGAPDEATTSEAATTQEAPKETAAPVSASEASPATTAPTAEPSPPPEAASQ